VLEGLRQNQAALDGEAEALRLRQERGRVETQEQAARQAAEDEQRVFDARAVQEALAKEQHSLLEQTRQLQRQRDSAQAALDELRAGLAEVQARSQQAQDEHDSAEALRHAAIEKLEQKQADTAQAQAEAGRLGQQADEAKTAHDSARERLRGVQQQNMQLENERIRTLAEIKVTKAKMREAEEEAGRLGLGKGPGRKTRLGMFAAGAAFAITAAALYVVPRYWPPRTVPAQAAPVVAKAAAPQRATVAAAPQPLYQDDRNARRDLSLSYELRPVMPAAPAKP
jgi:hypothetical protein